jgi:hypothetical protein
MLNTLSALDCRVAHSVNAGSLMDSRNVSANLAILAAHLVADKNAKQRPIALDIKLVWEKGAEMCAETNAHRMRNVALEPLVQKDTQFASAVRDTQVMRK